MRIMVLGGDGYLGWPTAMAFRRAGHQVRAIDNYLRRTLAAATDSDALMPNPRLPERVEIFRRVCDSPIEFAEGDCSDFGFISEQVQDFAPDAIVHYAEQPSAPYSMIGYDEARSYAQTARGGRLMRADEWDRAATAPGFVVADGLFEWVESPEGKREVRRHGSPVSSVEGAKK